MRTYWKHLRRPRASGAAAFFMLSKAESDPQRSAKQHQDIDRAVEYQHRRDCKFDDSPHPVPAFGAPSMSRGFR